MKNFQLSKIKKGIVLVIAGVVMAFTLTGCVGNNESSQGNAGGNPAASFDYSRSINVVSREDGSGTRGAFIELMEIQEKGADGSKIDTTTKEAIIAGKTDIMMTNIGGDKYAIGYVSLGSLNSSIKALEIDGAKASSENIKNGSYKVARPFNIATKGQPDEVSEDFISFILSKEGQAIVAKGYIAIDENAQPYSGTKPAGKIVVAGSSSVTPIMEKLREAYLAVNPQAQIEIQQSDSTAGMTGAIDGTCQIGMASRDLKDSEKQQLNAIEIALDGIAVIVNPENPINGISSQQVKDVFTGKATHWEEVNK